MKILSRAEELVLLSVWKLRDDAYGVTIRKNIIKTTGQEWSVGAIYVPLDRLTRWGYLEAVESDPTPERGGRRKRYYKLTESGYTALEHIKKVQQEMWENLPDISFNEKKII
jgi:DNA-binding PadR family transcriptional regulator